MLTMQKLYQKMSCSPSGIACTFVKLSDKWGLKLWTNKLRRDIAYHYQSEAATYGAGPEIGRKVDNIPGMYGYITQVADWVVQEEFPWQFFETHDKPWDAWDDFMGLLEEEGYDELRWDLIKIGFDVADLHIGNVGFIDGNMVCIDFGQDNRYESEFDADFNLMEDDQW